MRADEEWGSSSVLKQGKRASRSSGAAGSSVSFNGNASRRSAASTVGRSSVSEDVRRSNGEEPLGIAELGPPARPHTSLGQRADLERPAGYIVPKVFNEKDFQAFLARQKTRSAGGRLNELVGSLQKAPLLPITGITYRIMGGTYVERARPLPPRPHSAQPAMERGAPSGAAEGVYSRDMGRGNSREGAPAAQRGAAGDREGAARRFEEFLSRNAGHSRRRAQATHVEEIPGQRVVLPRARVQGFLARVRTGAAQRKQQLEKLAREMRAAALGAGTDFVERQRAATLTAEGLARIMARPDVAKQRQRWMEEIGLDAGQSAVLLARKTSPARVAEWYARAAASPCVSNREPRERPSRKVSVGLLTTGNPYAGGKADRLREALGPRAGLDPLPKCVE